MVRDINKIEDDIALAKRIIESVLCGDKDIVEVLDNPNIDPSCPDELLEFRESRMFQRISFVILLTI